MPRQKSKSSPKTSGGKRLDHLLVERGIAPNRSRAQALIMAGQVLVDDVEISKAGALIEPHKILRLRSGSQTEGGYVSRGAIKLKAALDAFRVSVEGLVALDVGASTGGFTDVLLKAGAVKIFALDVGHDQLDWKIRSDSRVVVIEKFNARNLTLETLGEKVDLIVMDLSFISITKVLESTMDVAKPNTLWITLIKPQFEAGPDQVGKGGIVRDATVHDQVIDQVSRFASGLGLNRKGLIESPISGSQDNKGNKEFLALWEKD